MSSKIRLALIGCGGIASAYLNGLRILRQHDLEDVEVSVLCSRNEESARRINERGNAPDPLPSIVPGGAGADPLNIRDVYVTDVNGGKPAKIYTEWKRAIADPDVDAVVILTPVDSHHVIGMGAIEAGKHVLIEKPMAITVRAARKLCEMTEERNLTVGVAESLRYDMQTRAARWAIDNDYIGHLEMVVHTSIGGVWAPDKIVGKTPWRHRKLQTGSGILMDIGTHLFDKIRYLFGEPRQVSGLVKTVEQVRVTRDRAGDVVDNVHCDVEDTAFANIVFQNGAMGSVNLSWSGNGQSAELPGGTVFYGDLGCIQGRDIVSNHEGTIPLLSTFVDKIAPGELHAMFPGGVENVFALELREFLNAIRDNRQIETSCDEGLKSVAMAFAVIESSLRREAIAYDDVLNCRIETYQRFINDHLGIN